MLKTPDWKQNGIGLIVAILALVVVQTFSDATETPQLTEAEGSPSSGSVATPLSATPTSATPVSGVFDSGGLGLSMQQAENRFDRFGAGSVTDRGRVYMTSNGSLLVSGQDADRVDYIERKFDREVSLRAARVVALRFGPADAALVETYVTTDGVTVDLYVSPSLANILPDPGAYPGGDPGNFTVSFGDYNPDQGVNTVTTLVISLGNSP